MQDIQKCFDDQLTYDRSRMMKTNESPLMVDESRISSLRKGINNKKWKQWFMLVNMNEMVIFDSSALWYKVNNQLNVIWLYWLSKMFNWFTVWILIWIDYWIRWYIRLRCKVILIVNLWDLFDSDCSIYTILFCWLIRAF